MWCVPPEYLCRNHLMGEHAELHQLVGTILRHPNGEAIAKGHAEEGNIDTTRIGRRHAKLATEITNRGYNHDSPIETVPPIAIGTVNVEENLQELVARCDSCRDRYESFK